MHFGQRTGAQSAMRTPAQSLSVSLNGLEHLVLCRLGRGLRVPVEHPVRVIVEHDHLAREHPKNLLGSRLIVPARVPDVMPTETNHRSLLFVSKNGN